MKAQSLVQLKKENEILRQEVMNYKKKLHYFQLLMDALPDHIYFKDATSRFTAVSRSMGLNLFDDPDTDKLLGLTDFDLFDHDHAGQAYDDEQEIIRTGKSIVNKEEKEVYPNGEVRWASTTKMPIYNEDNEVIGIFGLSRNITRIKKLLAEVEQLSERDQLTGLYNKRMFNSFLSKEWQVALRNNWNLSVLMIDIDFFKHYNDEYGHLEGDACLSRIAEAIKEVPRRPGDYCCRFGGEEFVVVLQDTDTEGAVNLAEHIMKNIHKLNIPHKQSSISNHVTISIGVSTVSLQHKKIQRDPSLLVDSADKALYEAKKGGRNRYCVKNIVDTTSEEDLPDQEVPFQQK